MKWFLTIGLVTVLTACGADSKQTASTQAAAQQTYKWKLVTSWPKNFPGLGTAPEHFAERVNAMSGGRLTIQVFGANQLVPALQVFDAVSSGTVEMGHSGAYYWKGKAPAAQFFSAVPFGMTAQEMSSWLHYGGGMELWEEVYAPFNLVPLAGGSTGVQMGGWFNKEINSVDDLKGLKMRLPGLGGEVLSRMGGVPVSLPGGEIFTSLQTGAIDATEWVGPYNDLAFGLHEAAQFYYYPGWHEPGSVLEFIVNQEALAELPSDLQAIVRNAARAVNQDMIDEYTFRNIEALKTIQAMEGIQIKRFPDEVLSALRIETEQLLKEQAAADPMVSKVYASFSEFKEGVTAYHNLTERAYLDLRGE
ncbi:TRAP transporter substrate-binding protein [Echinimonas agarilytica]|uniref:TRAP transporter substrate-binding protein DctP n=1 Tax=Echinimonas agarilytica TaxID=1215918 RepID=A0AA41W8F0_9GAMM|nr:TRAP transporter substrate-binding protein DctP [Echinimonas agarilytica]MCM2680563.1 TRAP transporter substrate-binding protein DctP [Echinimonas agarilytica]